MSAEHELFTLFAPLVHRALAPYRHDPLYEELQDEVYLIFDHVLARFDLQRGATLFTYLANVLPLRVRSYVRDQRKISRREPPWSNVLHDASGEAESASEELENTLQQLGQSDGYSSAARCNVEETVVTRLACQQALNALPPRHRAIVILRVADLDFEQIAAELRVTEAACRKAFHRARRALRETLKKI